MNTLLALIPLMAIAFSSCSQTSTNAASVKNVDVQEFKKLIHNGNAQLLDVRTPEEVANGKIPQAHNMDFYDDFKTAAQQLDKSKPVYVYCAAGGRSSSATKELHAMGFKEVYNLLGGFGAWKAAGLPIEN